MSGCYPFSLLPIRESMLFPLNRIPKTIGLVGSNSLYGYLRGKRPDSAFRSFRQEDIWGYGMIFSRTDIEGAIIIDLEMKKDDRGFFARTFCREEFIANNLEPMIEQCNVSYNSKKGTIRGMHMQIAPHPEAKFVRCISGAVYDIIVDMRPSSPTRFRYVAVELSAENHRGLYVPPFFAHGYQTLTDGAEVVYQVSGKYVPQAERGIRFSDPALKLPWPFPVSAISDKDMNWPLLADRNLAEFNHV